VLGVSRHLVVLVGRLDFPDGNRHRLRRRELAIVRRRDDVEKATEEGGKVPACLVADRDRGVVDQDPVEVLVEPVDGNVPLRLLLEVGLQLVEHLGRARADGVELAGQILRRGVSASADLLLEKLRIGLPGLLVDAQPDLVVEFQRTLQRLKELSHEPPRGVGRFDRLPGQGQVKLLTVVRRQLAAHALELKLLGRVLHRRALLLGEVHFLELVIGERYLWRRGLCLTKRGLDNEGSGKEKDGGGQREGGSRCRGGGFDIGHVVVSFQ
jgi:hypothetical protein